MSNSITEKDLTDALTLHMKELQTRALNDKIQLKKQEIIQFVGCSSMDDYVIRNVPKDDQVTFKQNLTETLISNNFEIWDKIQASAISLFSITT